MGNSPHRVLRLLAGIGIHIPPQEIVWPCHNPFILWLFFHPGWSCYDLHQSIKDRSISHGSASEDRTKWLVFVPCQCPTPSLSLTSFADRPPLHFPKWALPVTERYQLLTTCHKPMAWLTSPHTLYASEQPPLQLRPAAQNGSFKLWAAGPATVSANILGFQKRPSNRHRKGLPSVPEPTLTALILTHYDNFKQKHNKIDLHKLLKSLFWFQQRICTRNKGLN